jgi:hypothetical protein
MVYVFLRFSILLSTGLLMFVIVGNPATGYSQTPHPCQANGTTHMGTTLGGVNSYNFYFDKSCSAESYATIWTVKVYNTNNLSTPLSCSFGPVAVPSGPGPYGPVNCTGLTRGSGYQVLVVINFERSIGGPMSHSHYFYNP